MTTSTINQSRSQQHLEGYEQYEPSSRLQPQLNSEKETKTLNRMFLRFIWVYIILLYLTTYITAFVGIIRQTSIRSLQPLYSSITFDDDDDENQGDADALSKLIGKRDSIRKKRDVISKSSGESTSIDEPSPEKVQEILGGKTGMDVFEMPEFKNKRPSINRLDDETKDKSRGGPGSTMEQKEQDKFIDFQAEYDDENDFHIPNRIGFGTAAWGDPDRGFKAGKKMKKKEMKSGMFLAGDLQVRLYIIRFSYLFLLLNRYESS